MQFKAMGKAILSEYPYFKVQLRGKGIQKLNQELILFWLLHAGLLLTLKVFQKVRSKG